MGKFINPFTDEGFKRIFGREFSKPILLVFLNALLDGERKITNIKFLDKEQLGLSDGDRSLIYDIYCETEDGENIIVEMQNKSQPYFKNRSIYYLSRAIVEQGERGNTWKYDIKAVYLVAFLNFKQDDIGKDFRTDVSWMDMKYHTPFSDKGRIIYLQLPYFIKEADECNSVFERFIYVLKHMDVLQRMPWLAQDAVFKRLSEVAEVAALDQDERQKYDASLRHYRDTLAVMEGQYLEGEDKGRAEGREEGREEGRAEERLSMARRMKSDGVAVEMISKYTGLTVDEIKVL